VGQCDNGKKRDSARTCPRTEPGEETWSSTVYTADAWRQSVAVAGPWPPTGDRLRRGPGTATPAATGVFAAGEGPYKTGNMTHQNTTFAQCPRRTQRPRAGWAKWNERATVASKTATRSS